MYSVVQNNVDKLDVNIIAASGHPTSQPERHILATSYTSILFTPASRPRSPKMGMICKLHLLILLSVKLSRTQSARWVSLDAKIAWCPCQRQTTKIGGVDDTFGDKLLADCANKHGNTNNRRLLSQLMIKLTKPYDKVQRRMKALLPSFLS